MYCYRCCQSDLRNPTNFLRITKTRCADTTAERLIHTGRVTLLRHIGAIASKVLSGVVQTLSGFQQSRCTVIIAENLIRAGV